MVFYEIRITAQPVIRFAHTVCVRVLPESRNIIDHRRDMIELSCCDNSDMFLKTEYENFSVARKNFTVLMPDCRYDVRMTEGENITGSSVAVEIKNLHFRRYTLESYEEIAAILNTADPDALFLPQIISADEEEYTMLSAFCKTMISHYLEHTAAANLRALANWYEMIAFIDSNFRRGVETAMVNDHDNRTSTYYYVYKAKKYICAHYRERLTLNDIADTLGISPNYFCTIFKNNTGHTVIDYINHLRMQEVREIINRERSLSLREICDRVGLHDIRHLQRLFKKYYGVSIQRCRQIDNGLSLYHENPWELSDIDHDIFKKEP